MGWEIAQRIGITLVGRVGTHRHLLFTGRHRFVPQPRAPQADEPAPAATA
jgi:hypothetical protein